MKNGMNPQRSRRNQSNGDQAEAAVAGKYRRAGWKVRKEGHRTGYDFTATKGGRRRYVEVKSSKRPRLRPKQQFEKLKKGSKYKVHAVQRGPGGRFDLRGVNV